MAQSNDLFDVSAPGNSFSLQACHLALLTTDDAMQPALQNATGRFSTLTTGLLLLALSAL